MKEHTCNCSFSEKTTEEVKIECQFISCQEKIIMGDMVNHLKDFHKSYELRPKKHIGKLGSASWFLPVDMLQSKAVSWIPSIASCRGQTFVLQAHVHASDWVFWVTILGSEEEANKFEVKMSIPTKGSNKFYMGFREKVFSVDESVGEILKNRNNVLRLNKNLAHTIEDGRQSFQIDYQIICKKKVNSN